MAENNAANFQQWQKELQGLQKKKCHRATYCITLGPQITHPWHIFYHIENVCKSTAFFVLIHFHYDAFTNILILMGAHCSVGLISGFMTQVHYSSVLLASKRISSSFTLKKIFYVPTFEFIKHVSEIPRAPWIYADFKIECMVLHLTAE